MTAAITLLKAALALLIAVQMNPSLPPSFQIEATSLANTAIAAAEVQLESTSTPTIAPSVPALAEQAPVFVPSSGSASQQDCTPILTSYVTQSGDAETGILFTLNASSTFPTACTPDQGAYTLQTPTVLYSGNLGDQRTAPIAQGYSYSQGWSSATSPASGSFTWTVDGTSTTAYFQQQ